MSCTYTCYECLFYNGNKHNCDLGLVKREDNDRISEKAPVRQE